MTTKRKQKYKESDTITINRSQINFAAYNPRLEDPKVVDTLRRNFKKVAFLGGIAWNPTTGNVISGHKRLKALDIMNAYDGSDTADYEVKVESFEMDLQMEKEQNIFMNAEDAQGSFDFKMLADMLPDLDLKNTGLSDATIDLIELEVPSYTFGNSENIINDMQADAAPLMEQKQHEKEARKAIRQEQKGNGDTPETEDDEQQPKHKKTLEEAKQERYKWQKEGQAKEAFENSVKTYVTLSFSSAENKLAFMNRFGLDATQEFIKGESFSDMIERVN